MNFFKSTIIALFISMCCGQLYAQTPISSSYIRNLDKNSPVIIFVHGIFGDSRSTWTNGSVYWPQLLTSDQTFDSASIYVYEYPTELGGNFSIDEISDHMRRRLVADGVLDHKDIIFLAHSMGGLVTRAFLLKYREAARKTRFIYFFSTPTTGSEVASLATLISRNPQVTNMKPMQSAEYLADLQRQWLAAEFNIPSYCAYEKRPTFGITVVTQASGSNLCNRALDPIDADHMSIVKPATLLDDPYIAFSNAYKKTPPRLSNVIDNCKSVTENFSRETEATVCLDLALPSKSFRIRYIWLDSRRASLLLAGVINSELSDLVGAKPYLSLNKVTNEVRKIIENFGKIVTSKNADRFNLQPIGRMIKVFDPEDGLDLPDVEAYLEFQNSLDFPSQYNMYYAGQSSHSDSSPIDKVVLWRFLNERDLRDYVINLKKLRDIVQHRLRFEIGEDLSELLKQKSPLKVPADIAALLYFTRRGWPEKFIIATDSHYNPHREGYTFTFAPPMMLVQVAVLEGTDPKIPLRISHFKAEQIESDRIRPADNDGDWKALEFSFPLGEISNAETIVVPLRIELQTGLPRELWWGTTFDEYIDADQQFFERLKEYKNSIFLLRDAESNKILYKKRREAFKSPSLPPPTRKWEYGPRIRLIAAVSDGREIPLRQYNPDEVWGHLGSLEGSCPTVYVQLLERGQRVSHGHVLVGATNLRQSRREIIIHDGPAQFVEVVEEEAEITFVRSMRVFVIDALEHEQLVAEEFDRLVLPGLSLRIGNSTMLTAKRIRIEVEGYYRSMPNILLNSSAQ